MEKRGFEITTKRDKKIVKFEGDDTEYEVDPLEKTMETLKDYEVKEFSTIYPESPSLQEPSFVCSASSWFRRFKDLLLGGGEDDKPNPTPPSEKVTASQIKKIIKIPAQHWLFADKDYYNADINALISQMKYYKVANFTYELPYYDCDDFSFAAMGAFHLNKQTAKMAAFINWVTFQKDGKNYSHALNGACTGVKYYLIEPQNYKVFEIPIGYVLQVLIG